MDGSAQHGHRPRAALLFQIYQFLLRHHQPDCRQQLPAVGYLPTRGSQFLHVPVDELHHRHLPRPYPTAPTSARLCFLCEFLPAARGRSYRESSRIRSADSPAAHHHLPHDGRRRVPHPDRSFQESRHQRLYISQLRRSHLRQSCPLYWHRDAVGCLWLYRSDLLRLLRL